MKTKNLSTSIHGINSDKGLSVPRKILWFFLNRINNISFYKKSSIPEVHFSPNLKYYDWNKVDMLSSPARVLSNLFWSHLRWNDIRNEIGDIEIFDTGCGDGGYAKHIDLFSNKIGIKYYGVDFKHSDEWKGISSKLDNVKFKQHSSSDILSIIPKKTNFFMSQSAIEHFDEDLDYFSQIKRFIDKSNKNTIQVHIFPSEVCLYLYLFHGVRQYSNRTVNKIWEIFKGSNSYACLYNLGGSSCNKLHFSYITYPFLIRKKEDLRFKDKKKYINLLKKSIYYDTEHNKGRPSFYALIIHSNYDNKIF
jgi:hypothetical protein